MIDAPPECVQKYGLYYMVFVRRDSSRCYLGTFDGQDLAKYVYHLAVKNVHLSHVQVVYPFLNWLHENQTPPEKA